MRTNLCNSALHDRRRCFTPRTGDSNRKVEDLRRLVVVTH